MDFTSLAMTTVVVAVGSTEASRIAKKQPPAMKPVLAGFVLGVFLFGAGLMSEKIAILFCYLIIISSILLNGLSLFGLAKF